MACQHTKSYLSLLRAACTLVNVGITWNTSVHLGGYVALNLSGNSMFSGLEELASACRLCSFGVIDMPAFLQGDLHHTCLTKACTVPTGFVLVHASASKI